MSCDSEDSLCSVTKIFRQRDLTDCGTACLSFVAAHYRKALPVARLRQLAGTNQKGSTALGLVEAARQPGFTAKGVKSAADALPTVSLPASSHCLIGSASVSTPKATRHPTERPLTFTGIPDGLVLQLRAYG